MNEPGRSEKWRSNLPPGIRLTPAPTKSLSRMLVEGEVDAVLSAHPPDCFENGQANIAQLFEDYMTVKKPSTRANFIFPDHARHRAEARGGRIPDHHSRPLRKRSEASRAPWK